MTNSDIIDYKSTLADNRQAKRILELDGLRAFAVAFVVLFHMVDGAGVIANINPFTFQLLVILGLTGVHIFFVISGFIITSLLLNEARDYGKVPLLAFYQRRFFRIVPPLAVYLSILFLLFQLRYIIIKPVCFIWCLLFVGNFELFGSADSASGWFFGHTWSLSVEEQFYLIIPFILIKAINYNARFTTFLLTTSFIFCLLSLKVAKEASILHPALIKLSACYAFRYIIVGVLFALHRNRVQRILTERTSVVPLCLAFFIVASNFLVHIPGYISVIISGLEAICHGFFVLWFVENPKKCAALRWKWVQWVGACSYSIYLWQQLFTGKPSFYKGWTIAQSPYALIVIIACAALSYYYVEVPSIRLGRSAAKRSRLLAT